MLSQQLHCDDIPLPQPGYRGAGRTQLLAVNSVFASRGVLEAEEGQSMDVEVDFSCIIHNMMQYSF